MGIKRRLSNEQATERFVVEATRADERAGFVRLLSAHRDELVIAGRSSIGIQNLIAIVNQGGHVK